jgi:hypothetical protein
VVGISCLPLLRLLFFHAAMFGVFGNVVLFDEQPLALFQT